MNTSFLLSKEGRKISLFTVLGDFNSSKQFCETFFSHYYIRWRKSDSEKESSKLFDPSPGLSNSKSNTISITLLSSQYSPSLSTHGSLVIILSTVIRIPKEYERLSSSQCSVSSPGRARAKKAFTQATLDKHFISKTQILAFIHIPSTTESTQKVLLICKPSSRLWWPISSPHNPSPSYLNRKASRSLSTKPRLRGPQVPQEKGSLSINKWAKS